MRGSLWMNMMFYKYNESLMRVIMIGDDCMATDGWKMVEDVDDIIACDQQYCEVKLEKWIYDQQVGGRDV